jgi:hypothetical protein
MLKARLRLTNTEVQILKIVLITLVCMPGMASADWKQTIQQYGSDIRLLLYALSGTVAVSSLIWSGIMWLVARNSGDRSHTFMDYFQQVLVVVAVSASVAVGTAVWGIFGTGTVA